MIEVQDLVKTYGLRRVATVLDHVSLSIPKGSVFGLLGPDGAGKTTLLRILATTLRPTSGTVRIGGYEAPQDLAKIREILGFVRARGYFDPWRTGRSYMNFWRRTTGLSGENGSARVAEVTEFLGLGAWEGLDLRTLTVDQEKRLSLAQALLSDPDVLVLDNPLTAMTPREQSDLAARLRELGSQGKTLFISTSHLQEASLACDLIAVIEEGHASDVLKTAELLEQIGRGRHARIFVQVASPSEVLGVLKTLEGVVDVKAAPEVAIVYVNPGIVDAAKVRKFLDEKGVKVRSIQEAQITLGDLFRALNDRGGR